MNQEKKVAKVFKGFKTRASGALAQEKGDVVSLKLRIVLQCKQTTKSKFPVSIKLLDKCIKDAMSRYFDFYAGLFVSFINSDGIGKDQFLVQEGFLNQINQDIKEDILRRAVDYKHKSIIIQPGATIYRIVDSKNRVWYNVPAVFYKWI